MKRSVVRLAVCRLFISIQSAQTASLSEWQFMAMHLLSDISQQLLHLSYARPVVMEFGFGSRNIIPFLINTFIVSRPTIPPDAHFFALHTMAMNVLVTPYFLCVCVRMRTNWCATKVKSSGVDLFQLLH